MVYEKPSAYCGARMYLYTREETANLRNHSSKQLKTMIPQPVGCTVVEQYVEAGITGDDL
jgi:hypothetical protein